jgi:Gram-negative bacterial TonB protein C-terminal
MWRLATTACIAWLMLSAAAHGQTTPQASASPQVSAFTQDHVPVEVYKGPRVKDGNGYDYGGGIEGWVEFSLMVDPSGKPFEVTIVRSTGNKFIEDLATKRIEHATFEPGSLDGKPIEAGFEMKYQFVDPIHQNDPGARRSFVSAYQAAMKAIDAGDRAAADAALKALDIRNLYEDAFFGLATYGYASKWGDETEQLEGIRRALAFGRAYLRSQGYRAALLTRIRLELKTSDYAEAMRTWATLQKSGFDESALAPLRPIMTRLEKVRADDSEYGLSGRISDRSWYLRLFKRHFRAQVAEGHISEVKLRCDKNYVFFAFDPELSYEVSGKNGNCILQLDGVPGTRFTLVQF